MIAIVLACVIAQASQTVPPAGISSNAQAPANAASAINLLSVKRIYVDSFGDDAVSKESQSMIVTALVNSNRFVVTENKERADAILRGVALATASQELHAFHEGTIAGRTATEDASTNTETINHAYISLRLIKPDGDVIWTTTQESKGAKYKGASADAADMCVKQLVRDVAKAEAASNNTWKVK